MRIQFSYSIKNFEKAEFLRSMKQGKEIKLYFRNFEPYAGKKSKFGSCSTFNRFFVFVSRSFQVAVDRK